MDPTHDLIARLTLAARAQPRLDMYTLVHKALRAFMSATLTRLGSADIDDDADREHVLDEVGALLVQLRLHLEHENDFLHTAIEARRPGGARRFEDDHVQHRDSIASLGDEVEALRHARPEQRSAAAARLYRHLAAFVAENLEHMQREETENNALLWALYSDAELQAVHGQLVASVGPAEMALTVRWMCAALSVGELVGLYAGMRAKAPAAVYGALVEQARQHLTQPRWARLARALGEPPVPGLVAV